THLTLPHPTRPTSNPDHYPPLTIAITSQQTIPKPPPLAGQILPKTNSQYASEDGGRSTAGAPQVQPRSPKTHRSCLAVGFANANPINPAMNSWRPLLPFRKAVGKWPGLESLDVKSCFLHFPFLRPLSRRGPNTVHSLRCSPGIRETNREEALYVFS